MVFLCWKVEMESKWKQEVIQRCLSGGGNWNNVWYGLADSSCLKAMMVDHKKEGTQVSAILNV